MRAILLISHGNYAEAFKNSLEMVAGNVEHVYTTCLLPTDGPKSFTEKLMAIESKLINYDEVLIFADLFGGTPLNTAFQHFAKSDKFNFIAGMNFSMVLQAILSDDLDRLSLVEVGKDSIVDIREFIKSMTIDINE